MSYTLRPHKPADMDWVVEAHKEIPSNEFGLSPEFAQMVAQIVKDFVRNYDKDREHCWIAEINSNRVGCVFLVAKSDKVAQLRLLLVAPKARGLGIGGALIGEFVSFARKVGYERIVLGTDSLALVARRLYEKAGFKLVHSEPRNFFGRETSEELWELRLSDQAE